MKQPTNCKDTLLNPSVEIRFSVVKKNPDNRLWIWIEHYAYKALSSKRNSRRPK